MRIKYITSATAPQHYLAEDLPELAFAGRSNAGKSSLINAMAGSKVAKVSQVPGKTVTLNFFEAGDNYRLVDMPGYGYSKRSGAEQMSWQRVVETYLGMRPNLAGVLLIMDCRRKWDDEEKMLRRWFEERQTPWAVVLTKVDKLKKGERPAVLKAMKLAARTENVLFASSETKEGVKELEERLFRDWIQPYLLEAQEAKDHANSEVAENDTAENDTAEKEES